MSFYDDASWLLIPSGIKEDVVYAQKPTSGLGDLTFTRASDATYTDSTGVVRRSPYNLYQFSNAFTNAAWLSGGGGTAVFTDNFAEGPTGIGNASRWTAAAIDSQVRQNVATVGTIGTLSIYLRTISGTKQLRLFINDTTVQQTVTVTTSWQRFTLTGAVGSSLAGSGRVGFANLSVLTNSDYILAAGAQYVEGTSALDYFPTTNRQDVPRIDFRNADGTLSSCGRLLLEPQRTNVCLFSEQFGNGVWLRYSTGTVTTNSEISPGGTLDADLFVPNTTNYQHSIEQNIGTTSGTITMSVYAKASGYNWLVLNAYVGGLKNTFFDLQNGVIGTIASGVTASIQSAGNGWHRIICTVAGGANTYISLSPTTANNVLSFAGNGTSGILLWGAQLEAGAYPTTYIPTTTAAVTKIADTASKTGVSSLIGQTSGTLFVEWDNSDKGLINLLETYNNASGIGGTSSILIQKSLPNQLNIRVFDSLGNYSDNFTATMPNGINKVALAYQPGSATYYLNGALLGSNTRTYVFGSTRDMVGFDNRAPYPRAQAALFPTRLTNAQLAELTTL